MPSKPIVYIASPYTRGDTAQNVDFQLRTFNRLMDEGIVWPIAPLWSHFQHTAYPRPYEDWMEYDLALLTKVDALLRLCATNALTGYKQYVSSGADAEVEFCLSRGIPVFYTTYDLYVWSANAER
jgi:hypothetical protein